MHVPIYFPSLSKIIPDPFSLTVFLFLQFPSEFELGYHGWKPAMPECLLWVSWKGSYTPEIFFKDNVFVGIGIQDQGHNCRLNLSAKIDAF